MDNYSIYMSLCTPIMAPNRPHYIEVAYGDKVYQSPRVSLEGLDINPPLLSSSDHLEESYLFNKEVDRVNRTAQAILLYERLKEYLQKLQEENENLDRWQGSIYADYMKTDKSIPYYQYSLNRKEEYVPLHTDL